MSVSICTPTTISKVVYAASGSFRFSGYSPVVTDDAQGYAEALIALNIKAARYRYPREEFIYPNYSYPFGASFGLIECIKACHCWLYQCDALSSNLYEEVAMVARVLSEEYIRNLQEYDEADWGIRNYSRTYLELSVD